MSLQNITHEKIWQIVLLLLKIANKIYENTIKFHSSLLSLDFVLWSIAVFYHMPFWLSYVIIDYFKLIYLRLFHLKLLYVIFYILF